jgi:uncharacterized protein (TIRG00374 family)
MILLLAGLAAISSIAKAGKLQVLLVSLGQRPVFLNTLAISLATDFAFLSSPAGAAGYVVNIALLRKFGTSWSLATTVVGAEQALDLLFFGVAVPIAVVANSGPLALLLPKVSDGAYLALATVVLLSASVFWYGRHRIVTALHCFVGTIPWLQAKQERFGGLLSEVRLQIGRLLRGDAGRNLLLLALTSLQWLTRYGVLWVVLMELGYRLPFGFLLALQAGVLHLAQWTGIPAGGGAADVALAVVLVPWVSSSDITTVLILWRFATLYFPLIVGALSLAALTGRRSAPDFSP